MTSNPPATTVTAKRLEGKVALITGGASGVGESTARLYVKHGAKVLVADIQDDLGQSLCNDIGPEQTISYIHCDITNDTDVQNAVDSAVTRYGRLDIVFNNAAISDFDSSPGLLGTGNEGFKRVLEVNVYGAFLGAKHGARAMIEGKIKGSILFTASIASTICYAPGELAYAVSKNAVVGMAKNLSAELGQYGIRVNSISPYLLATPMATKATGMKKGKLEEVGHEAGNLKGEICEPEDVAEAALYLGSDESKYVSGLNLIVDGGYSQKNYDLAESFVKFSSS